MGERDHEARKAQVSAHAGVPRSGPARLHSASLPCQVRHCHHNIRDAESGAELCRPAAQ